MKDDLERHLLRRLRGELSAADGESLERRLGEDPEARELAARLATAWESLSLPPDAAIPPGFASRVLARARDERESELSWALAPRWAKLAAAAALVVGIAAGAGAVAVAVDLRGEDGADAIAWSSLDDQGMGESYLVALESEDESGRVEAP